jgi:hypothetical protein
VPRLGSDRPATRISIIREDERKNARALHCVASCAQFIRVPRARAHLCGRVIVESIADETLPVVDAKQADRPCAGGESDGRDEGVARLMLAVSARS